MSTFKEMLREQRWDDHRYYHHSRINQSLHLVSAASFVAAYVTVFFNPVVAVLLAWGVAMVTRQSGHFFFEPKSYDVLNQASHEEKEAIKVGYNLQRKIILMVVWALSPLVLWFDASFFGLFAEPIDVWGFAENTAWIWIGVALGALLFRAFQLFYLFNIRTGVVWMTKILTDPFHDIYLYYKAPYFLFKGQLLDPDVNKRSA